MTTLPDLLYVGWFAVAAPLIDYRFFWPAFRRRSEADPVGARKWLTVWTIGPAWALVTLGAALWVANDRSWTTFGLAVPDGWRLWTSVVLVALLAAYLALAITTVARNAATRADLRRQFLPFAAVMPHTRAELYRFGGLSLTAGFCEEFLYRGYFVWTFAPWLGWWGGAALSLPFFALGHLYQGWNGVVRTGIAGAVFTLVVALFDSLWPAIALHAMLDAGNGTMAWLALRDESTPGDAPGATAASR